MGFVFLGVLGESVHSSQSSLPLELFFQFYWISVFVLVPLLTMKSLAEERRQGTLQTLLTTKATPFSVVVSKFFGSYFFYVLLWCLVLFYPLMFSFLFPGVLPDGHAFSFPSAIGGLLFVASTGFFYIAIGIFSSSLTRSQLVSGILTFSLLFFIIVGGRILSEHLVFMVNFPQWAMLPSDFFYVSDYLFDFSKGIIDLKPMAYYLSAGLVMIGLATFSTERKV